MTITSARVWLDGALVTKDAATLPVMGHAPQRGSLVFDVGSFHDVPARGVALFRARAHVARFLRSAERVGLSFAWSEDALVSAAVEVVRASGWGDGLVRWSAFFSADEPDLIPRATGARVAVAALRLVDPPREAPLAVAVFGDARKAPPEALSPEVKAAAAYLGPMLARQRAIASGADEVVLLDARGDVAEAPAANVFAVAAGALYTPPLGAILPGITRDAVLTLARDEGIVVREERVARELFANADEAFLTATSLPVAAIGRVNDRALAGAPGPITERIRARVLEAQRGAREAWLTFV